jgi:hypothetical protein
MLEEGVAHDHAQPRPMGLRQSAGRGGQLARPHVARRGIDQIAHQAGCLGGARDRAAVGPFGPRQAGEFARLAVAPEGITAQGPAKGRLVRLTA